MPIHLPAISRRRFLSAAGAAAAGVLLRPWAPWADERAVDPNRFALLADTHINALRLLHHRSGSSMWQNMQLASKQIIALDPQPAAVIVNGDCAHLVGLAADYAALVDALEPMREAGLPVHLALGNHDHRENFWAALPPPEQRQQDLQDRHVTLLETEHVNFFLLDSLEVVNATPGRLGEEQIAWLASALDRHADKPALVVVHHQPNSGDPATGTGLKDTAPMLDVLQSRPHVKAWIFGHRHRWTHDRRGELHLINLPATAYVFDEQQPLGWVDARSTARGITFELRSLDGQHPRHGDKTRIRW
jgi:3',5'-cyclic-AMP phosphodiesterase